jgi:hypothetical protein
MVRKPDDPVGIEHEQAFTDRLYKIHWLDIAHGWFPARLLTTGLILDSGNTTLLGRPPPPPERVILS